MSISNTDVVVWVLRRKRRGFSLTRAQYYCWNVYDLRNTAKGMLKQFNISSQLTRLERHHQRIEASQPPKTDSLAFEKWYAKFLPPQTDGLDACQKASPHRPPGLYWSHTTLQSGGLVPGRAPLTDFTTADTDTDVALREPRKAELHQLQLVAALYFAAPGGRAFPTPTDLATAVAAVLRNPRRPNFSCAGRATCSGQLHRKTMRCSVQSQAAELHQNQQTLPLFQRQLLRLSWHCTLLSQEAEVHQQTVPTAVAAALIVPFTQGQMTQHHQKTLIILILSIHCALRCQEAKLHQ